MLRWRQERSATSCLTERLTKRRNMQSSAPLSSASSEPERVSLPGHGRDWRYYAGACTIAGAITASVPFFTRRTYLPMTIPEPPLIRSRRIAGRAFLYATCINMFLGIGLFGAGAYYFEIDNVHDIGWKIRRRLKENDVHQSGMAHSVRQSSSSIKEWFSQTWLGKILDEGTKPKPKVDESGRVDSEFEEDAKWSLSDDEAEKWFQEADKALSEIVHSLTDPDENKSDPNSANPINTASVPSLEVLSPPQSTSAVIVSTEASPSDSIIDSDQEPTSTLALIDYKLRRFDKWFDSTHIGRFLNSFQQKPDSQKLSSNSSTEP